MNRPQTILSLIPNLTSLHITYTLPFFFFCFKKYFLHHKISLSWTELKWAHITYLRAAQVHSALSVSLRVMAWSWDKSKHTPQWEVTLRWTLTLSEPDTFCSHTCCVSLSNLHSTSNFSLHLFSLSIPLPLAVFHLFFCWFFFYPILFPFHWISFIHQPCVFVGLIMTLLEFGMLST